VTTAFVNSVFLQLATAAAPVSGAGIWGFYSKGAQTIAVIADKDEPGRNTRCTSSTIV